MHWGGLYVQKQFAIERKEFSARMQQVFVSTTEEHEKGRFAPSVQAELSSFVKKSVFQDSSRVLYMWRICSRQFAENVQFLPAMMQYLAQNAEKDLACGFTFEDVTQMAWIVSRFPPEIDDSARTSQCSACIPEVAVHVAIKMYTDYFRLMDAPPTQSLLPPTQVFADIVSSPAFFRNLTLYLQGLPIVRPPYPAAQLPITTIFLLPLISPPPPPPSPSSSSRKRRRIVHQG